jgi:hypothetical protein
MLIKKYNNKGDCIDDNRVSVVNFVTSKNLLPSMNIPASKHHKYTWTHPDGKAHN